MTTLQLPINEEEKKLEEERIKQEEERFAKVRIITSLIMIYLVWTKIPIHFFLQFEAASLDHNADDVEALRFLYDFHDFWQLFMPSSKRLLRWWQ